jgi:error-prone DNA polymerase
MYVELHARSAFSFLEGASAPEELVVRCAELNMPAMVLADRDGVYGAPRFHMAAKKAGIRAHLGAEVTAADGSRYTLLVETRAGYQNLCRLITRMKLGAIKGEGALAPEELAEHAAGLVCLTGGEEGPFAAGIRGSGFGVRENGNWKLETRNSKPETRQSKIQNPKSRSCARFLAAETST